MSSMLCKKNGAPCAKYYESTTTIEMYDTVRLWLNRNTKKYPQGEQPSNKYLSNLSFQLLQFQEDAFGKNMKSSVLTKLPMKFFNDFKSGGGLCHVLGALLKYKHEQGLRRFDFLSPSRLDQNVEILMMLEKVLIQTGLLSRPTVCFKEEVDTKLLVKLSDIVRNHQGTVTSDLSVATHIVHPEPTTEPRQWFTPIKRQDNKCLIHFWKYPDSYDSWVSASECTVNEIYDSHRNNQHVHHVHTGWLHDLDVYNEWMNELDYQVSSYGEWIPPSLAKRKGWYLEVRF